MNFIQSMQQNLMTALLFWVIFAISIMLSKLYQQKRVYHDSDVKIAIKYMSRTNRNIWTIFIIILPALLIGFRSFDVGADTMNNVAGFLRIGIENNPIPIMRWDRIADSIFRYCIFILSRGNPTFFLFSMAFVTLFILIKALDKWVDKISMPLALFVYYALIGMQLLNQSRQLIALSIFLYAVPYLLERKYTKYLWCILMASLFHFTASIGIIFGLLYFKKSYYAPIKKMSFYIAWVLSPVLIYPFLVVVNGILPSLYQGYIEVASYGGIGFGLLITIFPVVIPIFLFRRYIVEHKSKYLARIALLTYPLRFAGYYSYYLMRLNYYSSAFMVFVIPIIIANIKSKSKKKLATFVMVVILITYYIVHYMYLDAGRIFPYKSIV